VSDAKRIKDLEDEVVRLRRFTETIAAQAEKHFKEMDKRISDLEGRGDI